MLLVPKTTRLALPIRPPGGFRVGAADPPYNFKSNSVWAPGRNSRRHYPCLSIEALCQLLSPMAELFADDAVLFLWMPTPFVAKGDQVRIGKALGFEITALAFTWSKLNKRAGPPPWSEDDFHLGAGLTTRKNTEQCWLGKPGKSLRKDAGVRELIHEQLRDHSRKPEEFYRRVERYVGGRGPFLDLFGRQSRSGWTVWGDEATKFDLLQELCEESSLYPDGGPL